MSILKQYEEIDLPFYRTNIAPFLPEKILDFHAHMWKHEHWTYWEKFSKNKSNNYMVVEAEYGIEELLDDVRMIFPDREYYAVYFGDPTPRTNIDLSNAYISKIGRVNKNLFPLILVKKNLYSRDELKSKIIREGFLGYKVFLPWIGNDYGNINVEDMIGSNELEVANEMNLVIMLHVPGVRRLADPETANSIIKYANMYPNVNIVLAHCGRCYRYEEIKVAVNYIKSIKNIYLDTSMVMDPIVLEVVFDNIDSKRVLYGTDFPVAAMKGKRVTVMDHWVDLVLSGYPKSDFRVISDNMRATFMPWEIAFALKIAGEMAGLNNKEIESIFWNNGIALLRKVMNGKLLIQKLNS